MHFPLIIIIVLIKSFLSCCYCLQNLNSNQPQHFQTNYYPRDVLVISTKIHNRQNLTNDNNNYNIMKTDEETLSSLFCSMLPNVCIAGKNVITALHAADNSSPEGRAVKDTIAIISTMLATLMGAILIKLKVLIVLTLISIAIGKLLLLIITYKSNHHHSGWKGKIAYEKIHHHHPQYHYVEYDHNHHHNIPGTREDCCKQPWRILVV